MRKFWRWLTGPEHGFRAFDGYWHTCHCGYHRVDDWDLKKHFAKVGVIAD